MESEHIHKYVIPVKYEKQRNFYPTNDKGSGYYGETYTIVTRLRCECGEEIKRAR